MIKASSDKMNVTIEAKGSTRSLANETATIVEVLFERNDDNGRRTLFSVLTLIMMAMKKVLDGEVADLDEAKNIVAAEIVQNALDSMAGKESKEDDQSGD